MNPTGKNNRKDNPAESGAATERHPLEPFFPKGARLLMCGTFPPKKNRWSMDFYYPNFINDMWRVFGLIYFDDKDRLVDIPAKSFHLDEIKSLLIRHHIALNDTGREVVRLKDNASDKFLDIRKPIPLAEVLAELPEMVALATTGEKAAGIIAAITGTVVPETGKYVDCELTDATGRKREFRHWRMPSTSRAYPLPLAKKAEAYRKMLADTGLLPQENTPGSEE